MKYIIKNCPAFVLMRTATSGTYFNVCGTAKGHVECKDITDCLTKQIVEKCYKATHEDLVITADYNKTACEVAEIYGRASLAHEVLQLLEIEEYGNE